MLGLSHHLEGIVKGENDGLRSGSYVAQFEETQEETKPYQPRCTACGSLITHNFEGFSNKTSLHAVQYVGDSGKPILERLCWLIAIIASLGVCCYLIEVQWRKWEDTPVIVSIAERPTPIWDIPFPAVTICPENKVKRTKFRFTEIFEKENKSEEETQMYYQLGLLCDSPTFDTMDEPTFNSTGKIDFSTNYIEKVAPTIDDVMMKCIWMGVEKKCRQYFTPVFTDEGLCYTFNALNANDMLRNGEKMRWRMLNGPNVKNWSLEYGYAKYDIESKVDERSKDFLNMILNETEDEEYIDEIYLKKTDSYPRRTSKSGSNGGLTIFLKTDKRDLDYACRWPVMGFKVLLHKPMDFPTVSEDFFRVSLRRDVVAAVQANVMTSSLDVAKYPVDTRGCVFQNEARLRYFKNYTQNNCELECYINETLHICGCVPFYFANEEYGNVCESTDLCSLFVSEYLLSGDIIMGVCECYPTCFDVDYIPQVTQSQLVWPHVLRHMKDEGGRLSDNFGRLSIYFKDIQFITSRRSELFGYTDFLANCGGLLGLCCGFSVLSAVEIIYFLSLCLCRRRAGR